MLKLLPRFSAIGLAQAKIMLVFSFCLGILLGLGFLLLAVSQSHDEFADFNQDIINLANSNASYAAWNLDPRGAEQVLESINMLGDFEFLTLLGNENIPLYTLNNQQHNQSQLDKLVSSLFFGEQTTRRIPLTYIHNGTKQPVGQLIYKLTTHRLAGHIAYTALYMLAFCILQASAIALVLLYFSSKRINAPLLSIINSIKNLQIEDVNNHQIEYSRERKNDEFTDLIQQTNIMLKKLSQHQQELRQLSNIDSLTHLPNRRHIIQILELALTKHNIQGNKIAVIFVDIDHFKTINDTLGHEIGDQLLIQIAHRFIQSLPENCSIGRLGGDEFLIIIEGLNHLKALTPLIDAIQKILNQPYQFENNTIHSTGSIGISICPDHGATSGELIRCADLAMYTIKKTEATWCIYTDDMHCLAEQKLKTQTVLQTAFENHEFMIHYQPKFHALSNTLYGCEALLRWQQDNYAVNAQEFITYMEESGLIVPLGYWVLESVCHQAHYWYQWFSKTPISINISLSQLEDPAFLEKTLYIFNQYDPGTLNIEFEIKESIILHSSQRHIETLKTLQQNGIAISIDNFGKGFTSLDSIAQLSFDIKIDKSIILRPEPSNATLNLIIAMTKSLNIKTTASGIEQADQIIWLNELGADFLQGNYFSSPISAHDFEQYYLKLK